MGGDWLGSLGSQAAAGNWSGQNPDYNFGRPVGTKRQQLEGKLKTNESTISNLELQNKEIREALELMSRHPVQERLQDLIDKLLR